MSMGRKQTRKWKPEKEVHSLSAAMMYTSRYQSVIKFHAHFALSNSFPLYSTISKQAFSLFTDVSSVGDKYSEVLHLTVYTIVYSVKSVYSANIFLYQHQQTIKRKQNRIKLIFHILSNFKAETNKTVTFFYLQQQITVVLFYFLSSFSRADTCCCLHF